MELEIISMTPQERMYSYSQSSQIEAQTGCIGHLRGDFGAGQEFFSSWFDHRGEYKTDEFKAEFDEVVNSLRKKDGLLFSRDSMTRYCRQRPEAEMVGNYCTEYGFKLKTDQHTYMLRCNPNYGDYNFYLYAYVGRFLEHHMEKAKQGIRFITPGYKEIFRIPDGDSIRIFTGGGGTRDRTCRFIDETHFETSGDYPSALYHICEFAEMQERNGNIYVPSAPKISGEIGTYEIYQIPATADADYCFRSYEVAKGKLQNADYQRSYAGMYAKENSLEHLWAKHNSDHRPFAHRMRSMSVSDIVVLTQGGRKTAYYTDSVGFKEVPEFLMQQRTQKKHKERGEAR